ncbi:MAG: hypothetical protein U9N40_04110, partial [Euryarchaeota archaeon]|nr:hypothetical protein [Euryarchaeota archaeon]
MCGSDNPVDDNYSPVRSALDRQALNARIPTWLPLSASNGRGYQTRSNLIHFIRELIIYPANVQVNCNKSLIVRHTFYKLS